MSGRIARAALVIGIAALGLGADPCGVGTHEGYYRYVEVSTPAQTLADGRSCTARLSWMIQEWMGHLERHVAAGDWAVLGMNCEGDPEPVTAPLNVEVLERDRAVTVRTRGPSVGDHVVTLLESTGVRDEAGAIGDGYLRRIAIGWPPGAPAETARTFVLAVDASAVKSIDAYCNEAGCEPTEEVLDYEYPLEDTDRSQQD